MGLGRSGTKSASRFLLPVISWHTVIVGAFRMAKKRENMVPLGGRVYGKLAADVGRELNRALKTEAKISGMNKVKLAEILGINKSAMTRSLSGTGNLTIRSIASILAALGHEMEVKAHRIEPLPSRDSNHFKLEQVNAAHPSDKVSQPSSVSTDKHSVRIFKSMVTVPAEDALS